MSEHAIELALTSFVEARAGRCRKCGERFRAPKVIYGIPTFVTVLQTAFDEDVVIGGCIPGGPYPARCGCRVARAAAAGTDSSPDGPRKP